MKIKSIWSDFQVNEVSLETASSQGSYSLYRLTKSGWTTPDAIRAIQRAWKIPFQRISFGGLKDRHALTTQYLTIWKGPQKDFKRERIELQFLGLRTTPFSSSDIATNQFQLTIRHLVVDDRERVAIALKEIDNFGLPNYFDDQRFGSVGADRRFIARELIEGRYEEALKLALFGEYEHDRADILKEKELIRQHWGDWRTLKDKLPRSSDRRLLDFLAIHPTDYRGSIEYLRPELQGLYLSAYQGYLWNRMLGRWLEAQPMQLCWLPTKLDLLPAPRQVEPAILDTWRTLDLPFPSARLKPLGTEPWCEPLRQTMEAEGYPLEKMKLPMRKPFFSKGFRSARFEAQNLQHEFAADDRNPGKLKLMISFELPPGSYATVVLKRLLQSEGKSSTT